MTTCDSGQGSADELLCTPRRAKRLFGTGGSSTKRSLFQQAGLQNQMDTNSGDESDLGPMSPLALTDRSPSSVSSQIPLMNLTWDRLKPSGSADKRLSPFSTLRHVTKTARSSPRRKIFPDSPKSCTRSPKSCTRSPATSLSKNLTDTPVRTIGRYTREFILATPLRDFMTALQNENTIAETPQKEESPEVKQITPLGSVNNKNVRTLDTKSFYGSGKQQRLSAFGVDWKQFEQTKKRRSLPAHHAKSTVRQFQKRHKKGEINCGVSHGLKKPKPKKHVSKL